MKRIVSMLLLGSLGLFSAAPAFADGFDRRVERAERMGRVNPGEARRLEARDGRIHREIRHERWENGGRLTFGERCRVRGEERAERREFRNDEFRREVGYRR